MIVCDRWRGYLPYTAKYILFGYITKWADPVSYLYVSKPGLAFTCPTITPWPPTLEKTETEAKKTETVP